ncbi:MAG TPA: acetylglutamate kinase, partial [Planctomycetaceae bacterium]|nr:acetylglutamate kinase [Planctomycetaceae bacterium]
MKISVLKLGGSLLDLPDLKDRLSEFLAQLQDRRPLLICGGGSAV